MVVSAVKSNTTHLPNRPSRWSAEVKDCDSASTNDGGGPGEVKGLRLMTQLVNSIPDNPFYIPDLYASRNVRGDFH